ncbi:pseudouridine synthase [Mariprofundus erugo]|uniref:pseudouridine synthase n=1 Tax=Mariprofundus erugo TaxID=2528639 RepID=UPI0010FD4156|nr:pseudouridine synthase [Mariprofundus erugo]TLS77089.1 pseudouridine synthase [Mariprofundus erugo]
MPATSTAPTPSYVTLPKQERPYPSLLDYLDRHFPFVARDVWQHRLQSGKITDETGAVVGLDTPYRINARLRYFREISHEYPIPFQEKILFQNDVILVADKPHFLPVTPSGNYVNECLLHRLKRRTGLEHLVPVHRLDRETAGLVLFTVDEAQRRPWFDLFRYGGIEKTYEAIAARPAVAGPREWLIESRIERGEPWLRFRNVEGEINARSRIRLIEERGALARYELEPITGKTHQLRLHMGLLGAHMVGDRFYPDFQPPEDPPNYENPLQLLAKHLAFTDPVTGEPMSFTSELQLNW